MDFMGWLGCCQVCRSYPVVEKSEDAAVSKSIATREDNSSLRHEPFGAKLYPMALCTALSGAEQGGGEEVEEYPTANKEYPISKGSGLLLHFGTTEGTEMSEGLGLPRDMVVFIDLFIFIM